MPVILLTKNGVLSNQKEEKHCAYSADSAVYVNADISTESLTGIESSHTYLRCFASSRITFLESHSNSLSDVGRGDV